MYLVKCLFNCEYFVFFILDLVIFNIYIYYIIIEIRKRKGNKYKNNLNIQ